MQAEIDQLGTESDRVLTFLSFLLEELCYTKLKAYVDFTFLFPNVQASKHPPLLVSLLCDELKISPEQMLDFELCLADTQPAVSWLSFLCMVYCSSFYEITYVSAVDLPLLTPIFLGFFFYL